MTDWNGPWDGAWAGGWTGQAGGGGASFADGLAAIAGRATVSGQLAGGAEQVEPVSLPSTLRRRLRALVRALPTWTWVPVPETPQLALRVSVSASLSGAGSVVARPGLYVRAEAALTSGAVVSAAATLGAVSSTAARAAGASVLSARAEATDRYGSARAEEDEILWLLAA